MDASTEKYLDAKFDAIDTSIHNNREIFSLKFDSIIEHNEAQDEKVDKLSKKVGKNTAWRIRTTAIGTVISGIIGFILFKFSSILTTIKDLISE